MDYASKHYLYDRWLNMIGRCYSKTHSGYKSYGEKGILVEDYLRNFRNYIEFVESLPNIEKLKEDSQNWNIDKDLKGGRIYSRDTLSIITTAHNLEIQNKDIKITANMHSLEGEFIQSFESISEAERRTGIHRGNIARNIRGESNTAGGYIWK